LTSADFKRAAAMSDTQHHLKETLLREAALFLGLFFAGIVLLPIAIYLVGQSVFGDYGGRGFADFYASLHYEMRAGQNVPWYLVLSPYLGWQLFRLTLHVFRKSSSAAPQGGG
jgi:hypothetical protein